MPWYRLTPRNRPIGADAYCQRGRVVFFAVRTTGDTRPFVTAAMNDAVIGTLRVERQRSACLLHAYCLMPDHIHLLVAPAREGASVLDMVRRFKGRATRTAWTVGGRGRLWQPRYYDRVLRQDEAIERLRPHSTKRFDSSQPMAGGAASGTTRISVRR